jgi:uncharacterized protein YdhG (YjbR/CyaY superfamily)
MATAKKAPAKKAPPKGQVLSAEEKAAMAETVRERKRGSQNGEADVLAKIAEMNDTDRPLAERIHAIVKKVAPELTSKTWYGMPAYVNAEGKTICFFQSGAKFKTRYSTLGFQEAAKLDDGNVWANAYAIIKLTPADEAKIAALIRQAVG